MNANGRLLPGQAFATNCGQLKHCISKVIYAVISVWQGGASRELDMLYEAVFCSMTLASDFKANRIAIAGVSCGYPADASCTTLIDAVAPFIGQSLDKLNVCFVDPSDLIVNYCQENIRRHFGKDQIQLQNALPRDIGNVVSIQHVGKMILESHFNLWKL